MLSFHDFRPKTFLDRITAANAIGLHYTKVVLPMACLARSILKDLRLRKMVNDLENLPQQYF